MMFLGYSGHFDRRSITTAGSQKKVRPRRMQEQDRWSVRTTSRRGQTPSDA